MRRFDFASLPCFAKRLSTKRTGNVLLLELDHKHLSSPNHLKIRSSPIPPGISIIHRPEPADPRFTPIVHSPSPINEPTRHPRPSS